METVLLSTKIYALLVDISPGLSAPLIYFCLFSLLLFHLFHFFDTKAI